jgi:hypothetical protein
MHYLVYGIVYYLTIPCMYMLLTLYCVFNLETHVNFDPQETHYTWCMGLCTT